MSVESNSETENEEVEERVGAKSVLEMEGQEDKRRNDAKGDDGCIVPLPETGNRTTGIAHDLKDDRIYYNEKLDTYTFIIGKKRKQTLIRRRQMRRFDLDFSSFMLRNWNMGNGRLQRSFGFTDFKGVVPHEEDPLKLTLKFKKITQRSNDLKVKTPEMCQQVFKLLRRGLGLSKLGKTKILDEEVEEISIHSCGLTPAPFHTLKVFTSSFNCGDVMPPEDLSSWLPMDEGIDLFVIGTQECEAKEKKESGPNSKVVSPAGEENEGESLPASPKERSKTLQRVNTVKASKMRGNRRMSVKVMVQQHACMPGQLINRDKSPDLVTMVSQNQSARSRFHDQLEDYFGNDFDTVVFTEHWDRGLHLFMKKDLIKHISRMETGQEATGIAHIVGNKGGMVVKFQMFESSLCFVNCHLEAQHGNDKWNPEDRNQNIKEILHNIRVGQKEFDFASQFHFLFWMGDLNYRINLPRDHCLKLIEKKSFDKLHKFDQLLLERQASRVFRKFKEGPIDFRPTYRWDRNADTYSEEKGRVPSYCDRIMYQPLTQQCQMRQLVNSSCESITTSDHRPVYSTFEVNCWEKQLSVDAAQDVGQVVFEYIECFELPVMDKFGQADPYIEFHCELMKGRVKSSHIDNTLNPRWEAKNIPAVGPMVCDKNEAFRECIKLIVYDYDVVSKHDVIGFDVIPLAPLVAGQTLEFRHPLLKNGVLRGYISGMCHIEWENVDCL